MNAKEQDDLFSRVYVLNGSGRNASNRSKRDAEIAEILPKMNLDTLRKVNTRLRMHAGLHHLVDTLIIERGNPS